MFLRLHRVCKGFLLAVDTVGIMDGTECFENLSVLEIGGLRICAITAIDLSDFTISH